MSLDSIKYTGPDATGYDVDNLEEQIDEEEVIPDVQGVDRQRLILTLEFYICEFPKQLERYKNFPLERMPTDDLVKLREEFNFSIGVRNNIALNVNSFQHGLMFLEGILPQYGINIQGISNLGKDEQTIDDVKALSLKYLDLQQIEPEHRLLYKVLSTGVQLHLINSQQTIVDPRLNDKKFDSL